MKKLFLVLAILFTVLTFLGAGYVLAKRGSVNAGYAVVPMVFTLIFTQAYRSQKEN